MAENTFDLPDLGEGLTEAEILRWLVAEGDEVALDQPIVEVETAKSVVEVPSLYAGRVHTLHGAEGETLAVGAPLITLDDGEGNDDAGAPAAGQAPAGAGAGGAGSGAAAGPGAGEFGEDPADRGASYREEERAGMRAGADERLGAGSGEDADGEGEFGSGSGNVLIGYGTTESSGTRRRRRPKNRGAAEAGDTTDQSPRGEAVRVVSPLVRRLAREGGLDLTHYTHQHHYTTLTWTHSQTTGHPTVSPTNAQSSNHPTPTPADCPVHHLASITVSYNKCTHTSSNSRTHRHTRLTRHRTHPTPQHTDIPGNSTPP